MNRKINADMINNPSVASNKEARYAGCRAMTCNIVGASGM